MRVKPILQFGLVAGALALPGAAWALGLGKLTVDSALGQPLSARIELLSATREELDSLTAKVADPALYRQNNLSYQGVLSRTRVSIERGAGDTAFLRVTSPTAVTEPYLDLLVDVNWSAGRVVRDYTFLLDPPGAPASAPVDPVTPLRVPAGVAARAPAASAASAPAAAPVARRDGDSYEVKRGDTLSKIAKEYKPETVTLEQMLVALFKSNQSAFEGSNMNRLRSGAIISLPNAVDASATPAPEAANSVKVQASDWRTYRDRVAGGAPLVEEGARRAAGGRIGTAVEERTPAARAGGDQLRVSKDAGSAKAGGTAETSVAREAQLRDSQARIAELEKTVRDLQRANELRNPAMAQSQILADASKAKAPAPPAPVAKAPEPAKVEPPKAITTPAPVVTPPPAMVPPPAPKAVEPPKMAETPKVELPKAAEPAKVEAPKVEAPKVEAPKVEAPKVEPPKAAPPAPPKVVAKAPAKEPPGFFEDLLGSTPPWAIGAGALAILGGIAALIAARRRKTTKFEDSIISGTDIKTNTVFGSTGGGVVNTGDNSLASDFSREGLGNIDTDEVDPIAEAEVYLAYGRDAQAEEILKDALKKDPQRQEIYLKLLEIHAQHNKPSAFETVASELYSVTSGQGETWQKAVALGRQLDPNNPMFAEGGMPMERAAMAAAGTAAAAGVGAMAFKSDLTKVDIAPGATAELNRGLDFQMDEEISISPSSGRQKSPADILAGAQSELERTAKAASSGGESDADKTRALGFGAAGVASAAVAGAVASGKSGIESYTSTVTESVSFAKDKVVEAKDFDLDFKLDDADKPAPMGKPRGEPMLETASAGAAAMPSALTRPAATMELDKLDLSFDPDRTTFEDPTPSVLDGQWHDAATKLDLAKAYQEMGDVEGAREILQEVLHEGDDQQKAEAKSLLGKLS